VLKRLYQQIVKPQRVLFYRDLIAHTGGHQKVADYFGHLQSSFKFQPDISFSERTHWDSSNPWFPTYQYKSVVYNPLKYDLVFLAGTDWQQYLSFAGKSNKPVINFIQHVRHADPVSDVFEFLSQPAVRICVSQQVADAIQATSRVNGPVFTIPNGVDLPLLARDKAYDLIILGIKQPAFAKAIHQRLASSGLRILVVDQWVPREEWFGLLAASRLALLLPNPTEGFYLPALEAMYYSDLVVVPDCIGNRDFCMPEQNCLMPAYDVESVLTNVNRGLALLNSEELAQLKHNAANMVRAHSLANERKAFLKIMGDMKNLWPV
jgi:glycosyltransferase involved in cell wall biosynthesis